MSASLVGSEMCIRDRTVPARFACVARAVSPFLCASVRASASLCASVPVSYTHLTLPTICSV
eukprot:3958560-Alexandrium_andersonii.AAC.1